jgi:hypothetical protein
LGLFAIIILVFTQVTLKGLCSPMSSFSSTCRFVDSVRFGNSLVLWRFASLAVLCAVVVLGCCLPGELQAATLESFEIEATDSQVNVHLHGSDTIETLTPQPYQGGMSVVLPNTQLSPRLLKQGLPVVMDGQARFIGRAVPAGNNQVRILLPNVPANQMAVRVSQTLSPHQASSALPQVSPSTPSYGQVITLNEDDTPAPAVAAVSSRRSTNLSRSMPQVTKGRGPSQANRPSAVSVARPVAKTITMPKPSSDLPPPTGLLAMSVPGSAPLQSTKGMPTTSPGRPAPAPGVATVTSPSSPSGKRTVPEYLKQAYRLAPPVSAIASAALPSSSAQAAPPLPEVVWDVPTPSSPEPAYLASDWSIDGGYGPNEAEGVAPSMVYIDMPTTPRETLHPVAHPSLSMLNTQWYADQAVADLESKLAVAAKPSGLNWIWVALGFIGLATLAVLVASGWMRQRWALAQDSAALTTAGQPKHPLPFSIDSVSLRPKVGWATVPKRLPFEAPLPQMMNWSSEPSVLANTMTNPLVGATTASPAASARRWVAGESLVPAVPVGLPKAQAALAGVSSLPVSVVAAPRYGRKPSPPVITSSVG